MITLDELRAMDDQQFNRAIAELAGRQIWRETWMASDGVIVVTPSGHNASLTRSIIMPVQELPLVLPDYANDINIAWQLCEEMHQVVLSRYGADAQGETVKGTSGTAYDGFHHQPARALTMAWAAWKLEQCRLRQRELL